MDAFSTEVAGGWTGVGVLQGLRHAISSGALICSCARGRGLILEGISSWGRLLLVSRPAGVVWLSCGSDASKRSRANPNRNYKQCL